MHRITTALALLLAAGCGPHVPNNDVFYVNLRRNLEREGPWDKPRLEYAARGEGYFYAFEVQHKPSLKRFEVGANLVDIAPYKAGLTFKIADHTVRCGWMEYRGYEAGTEVRLTHKVLHSGEGKSYDPGDDKDFDPSEREELTRLAGQVVTAFRAALKP